MISIHELDHVDRDALARRLRELGWRTLKHPGALRDPRGRLFYIPRELKSDLDYVALRSVVEALLDVERVVEFSDLSNRINGKKEDLLFFGCEVVGMPAGRLPMRAAPSFFENATRFFRTTIDSTVSRRARMIPGVKPQSNFLDRLQYGQSREGSYMVTVHVPVDTIHEPIGRLVVRDTIQAFGCLEVATQRGSDEPLLSSTWTAPMCEAILKFVESPLFAEVKMQAAPDPIWNEGAPVSTDIISVPLRSSAAPEVLAAAAAKLRGLKESQWVEVVGIPYATRDDVVIGEGNTRLISVKWLRDDAPPMKVQAQLSEKAYEEALRAVSKCHIKLAGWLRQKRSRWILETEGMPTLLDVAASPDDLADSELQ